MTVYQYYYHKHSHMHGTLQHNGIKATKASRTRGFNESPAISSGSYTLFSTRQHTDFLQRLTITDYFLVD